MGLRAPGSPPGFVKSLSHVALLWARKPRGPLMVVCVPNLRYIKAAILSQLHQTRPQNNINQQQHQIQNQPTSLSSHSSSLLQASPISFSPLVAINTAKESAQRSLDPISIPSEALVLVLVLVLVLDFEKTKTKTTLFPI